MSYSVITRISPVPYTVTGYPAVSTDVFCVVLVFFGSGLNACTFHHLRVQSSALSVALCNVHRCRLPRLLAVNALIIVFFVTTAISLIIVLQRLQ